MHFSGIVLCGVLAALANASKVVLKDNGYENILVSISEKATRNQADEIIRTIKVSQILTFGLRYNSDG